jgi:hypothetical protein
MSGRAKTGRKTGTKRVPKQANPTSRSRTQFHEIAAKQQVFNIPEATPGPEVIVSARQPHHRRAFPRLWLDHVSTSERLERT